MRASGKIAWGILYDRNVVELKAPLFIALIAAVIGWALTTARGPAAALSLDILVGIIAFIGAIATQYVLLRRLFGRALGDYIDSTSSRHVVIKSFGAEILQRFLSEAFDPDLIGKAESLPWMLQRLEGGEYELPLPSYAMLLDAAAAREPHVLHAIWHVRLVPIDDVVSTAGHILPAYIHYFHTLRHIYATIAEPRHKQRLYVFPDEKSMVEIQDGPGWKALCRVMASEWGMTEYWTCDDDLFQNLRKLYTGEKMDDLVYFAMDGSHEDAWMIGMKYPSRAVGFRHGPNVMQDFRNLWDLMSKHVHHVQL